MGRTSGPGGASSSDSRRPTRPVATAGDYNRLLRLVDWRVLLATPEPGSAALLGHPAGGDSIRAVAGTVVEEPPSSMGEPFDLVLSGGVDAVALRRARGALRPGGCLQLQFTATHAGRLWRLRRRLRRLGFTDIQAYMPVRPAPDGLPVAWLPIGAVGALTYFSTVTPRGRAAGGRVRRIARRLLWRLRGWAVLPTAAVVLARTSSSGPRADPARPTDGATLLASIDATRVRGGGDRPSTPSSLLLLTPGQSRFNKIVGLVFDEPNPSPRLAIKVPRVPESTPGLRNEAHVLRTLARGADVPFPGLPALLFSQEHHGLLVVGESFVKGLPFSEVLRPATANELALRATDWLAAFALWNAAGRSWLPAGPRVANAATDFAERFAGEVDPTLLTAALKRVESLGRLPLTCEQRDFAPWNLRVTGAGELGVLDWESAVIDGLPLLDLLYLLAYIAFYLDGARQPDQYLRSYRALRDPSTATGAIADQCVARYLERLGMSSDAVAPLRVLTWMIHAAAEHRRLGSGPVPPSGPGSPGRSLFLRLWEEELRDSSR